MPRSLDHVPRRGVMMAKALRRMGLEVVPVDQTEGQGDDPMSSNDVKQVSESARAIAEVGKTARKVREKLDASIADINDALEVADGVADALRSAGAELRGVLGTQTNNPPNDNDGDGGDDSSAIGGKPYGAG